MMKLQTYAAFSFLATVSAIYYAFRSREQFYPAMVHLSTSKICFVLLLNMGLVIMCIIWRLVMRLFLGSLREAEVERLNEQSWREAMEILFAITIFRQDFSITFLAMVTALLFIKALHWLAQKRVEYIETTPSVPTMSHVRIVSFMLFLLFLDVLLLSNSLNTLVRTRQASVALFFLFEYTILATTTVATFVKYVFYVTDMILEGQWERKAVYTFYLELVRDLLHLSLYICFFLVIFLNYGIPLHLIRELYDTFRSFRMRVADYVRYRKITSNMNERFPDATQEELNAGDATCIICREEMTTAKKLLCGHLFHVHCLRSWLERQHTCPTCRALVVPAESGPVGSRHPHLSESIQPVSGTSAQGSHGNAHSNNLSRHHARLQAAVSAASVYEKSLPFPTNSFWASQYSSKGQVDTSDLAASSELLKQSTGGADSFAQLPQFGYMPFQMFDSSSTSSERSATGQDLQLSLLKAQADLIQSQIQFLQAQKQLLEKKVTILDAVPDNSDSKGKAVVASSSAAYADDHVRIGDVEDVET